MLHATCTTIPIPAMFLLASNVCNGFAGIPISAMILLASNFCNGFAGIAISAMVLLALDLAIKTTKHNVGTGAADTEHAEVEHD